MKQETYTKLLFWDVNQGSNTHGSKGAGIQYNDTVNYLTSHNLLLALFIAYCLIWFLYALISITPVIDSPRIAKAHRLWTISTLINLLWVIFVLPRTPNHGPINGLVILELLLILYITCRIPEGMILSNAQIIRSYSLLVNIDAQVKQNKLVENIGMQSFLEYVGLIVAHPDIGINAEAIAE